MSGITAFATAPSQLSSMASGLKMNLTNITKNISDLTTNISNNISNITNANNSQATNLNANHTSEPELGFTIELNQKDEEIVVNVTRGRYLPTKFGIRQVKGYFLKVKLYPGQKKYESNPITLQKSTDLSFNETFKFSISKNPNKQNDKDSSSKLEKLSQKLIQKFGQKSKDDNLDTADNSLRKNEDQTSSSNNLDLNGFFVTITLCACMSDLIINENTYKAFKKTVDAYCENIIDKKNGNKKSKENEKEEGGKSKKDNSGPDRSAVDSKRTIGTVTCTLSTVFNKSDLEKKAYLKSKEIWKAIKDIREMTKSFSSEQSCPKTNVVSARTCGRKFSLDASTNAAQRRLSVLDASRGQVEISLCYGDKMQPPKRDLEAEKSEKSENVFSRKSLSRFSLRRFISQESSIDDKDDKNPSSSESSKEPEHHQHVHRPANPFDRIIADLEDSDSGEEDDINPFKEDEKLVVTDESLNYLSVRIERIKCSRKVKDDLDIFGGHLYLKSYVVDDDRKLVSLQCPRFVLTSLSRHFDPSRSLLIYPCDEVNLQYTSAKICLYNKDKFKKRTLLGSVRISEQDINELKSNKNQTVTKWYCIV